MSLLGREAEKERIDRLLTEARAGISGVLRVSGEAGIGKSALCDYAIDGAESMRILRATGVETEVELAFAGLADLLQPVLGLLPRLPAPQEAALAGALAVGPPVSGDRFTICAATLSLLAAAAEESPLLCVVDDAQWLDVPSAEALLFAARRLDAEGVALVVAVREGGESIFSRAPIAELRLGGLDTAATQTLLEVRAHGRVPEPVAERLCEATGGNPLALLELAVLVPEDQLLGEEPLPQRLPEAPTPEQELARRTEGLSDEALRTLLVAAASASTDVGAVVRAASAVGGDPGALGAAEEAGILRIDGNRVDFSHPLLRAAVYGQAKPAVRRAAHHALAEAEVGSERRAWHLAAATAEPDAAVAAALEDAARQARERGGHASAASALERAAQLTPGDEDRARRLLEAADEARRAGRSDQAFELLDEALAATTEPLMRADIQHLRGVLDVWIGTPNTAHGLLVDEAERIVDIDARKAALMMADAAWAALTTGEIMLGLETAERAYEIAQLAGGVEEALTAVILAEAKVLRGQDRSGVELLDRCRPLLEDPHSVARAAELVQAAGQVLTWIEDYDSARRLLTRVIDTARERSSPGTLPYALASLSELDFRTGNWSAAYAGASEALRLATETGQLAARAFSLVCLARLEAVQGREAECRSHTMEAFELAAFGVRSIGVFAASSLALLELGHGHNDVAIEHLERVSRTLPRHAVGETAVVQWAPDLIEALIRSGRTREAQAALADFEAQAESTGRNWALAAAARCRGLAAETGWEEEFLHALELHERTPTPFERARTLLCFGERLRRGRRRAEARDWLRAALDTFERLGATSWVERARTELAASGETLRPREGGSFNELTPQELQVALVVAKGATNREAGAALFLSSKTIETHLGRIYRKLGVRSRTELAAALAGQSQI